MSGNKANCPEGAETMCPLSPEHPCSAPADLHMGASSLLGCPCARWAHLLSLFPLPSLGISPLVSLSITGHLRLSIQLDWKLFSEAKNIPCSYLCFPGCLAQGKSSSTNRIPRDYFTSNRRRIFMFRTECLQQTYLFMRNEFQRGLVYLSCPLGILH